MREPERPNRSRKCRCCGFYRGIAPEKPRQPGRGVSRRGAGLAALGPCPGPELPTRDRSWAVFAGGTAGWARPGAGLIPPPREAQPPLPFWTETRGFCRFPRHSSQGLRPGSVWGAQSRTGRPREPPVSAARGESPSARLPAGQCPASFPRPRVPPSTAGSSSSRGYRPATLVGAPQPRPPRASEQPRGLRIRRQPRLQGPPAHRDPVI